MLAFPRLAPAMITLVTRGDEALLAAGLLAVGSRFLGTVEQAADLLTRALDRPDLAPRIEEYLRQR